MNEFFEQINKSLLADSQKIEQINKSLLADSKKIEQIKKSLFSDSKNVPEAKKTLDEMVASLERNGKKINQIIENNEESLRAAYGKIQQKHQEIENLIQKLNDKEEELNKKIKNADETMVLATTVGLAGAFDQRAKELKMSMRYWVGLLILALGIGGWLGYQKMQDFLQLIKDSKATSEFIWIYMILALASFGAPLWFAWLASKQIGQRFKLAEDYAFKASVAKAYEGYKTEAARLDKDFEARLFSSALTRLEEAPLRFMNNTEHSSPVHEMIKLCTPTKKQQTESKQPVKTEPE